MKHLLFAFGILFYLPSMAVAQSANYESFAIYFDRFCGLLDDGRVECTAVNFPKFQAIQAPVDGRYAYIDSGRLATCAITTTAELDCWGDEGPDGEIFPPSFDLPVTDLSVAPYHSCAIDNEGGVKCWGQNVHGQTEPPQSAPAFVDVEAFSIFHSCGITETGELICWGRWNDTIIPADLDARTKARIVDIEANEERACVIDLNGNANCWQFIAGSPQVATFDNGPYQQVIPLRSGDDYVACALTFNGELDCVPAQDQDRTPVTELPATRLPATYKVVEYARPTLFGLTFNDRIELITSAAFQTEQDLVDLANRETEMPRMEITGGEYYGAQLGTEFFFESNVTRTSTYTQRYDAQIFRNGELIDTTSNERSYIDKTTVEGVEYSYTIRAVHPFGQTGPMSDAITVTASVQVASEPVDPSGSNRPDTPAGLRAEVYWFDVELFWDRNFSGNVQSYEIRRNGELVGTTRGISWYDNSTTGGEKYQYDVLAVDNNNQLLGIDSVSVQIGPAECS